ncbi:MAG: nuclear transport factor 2 family protein [Plesiomonas shigelloides]
MLDATQKVALVTQFWDAFDHGQFHLAGTLLTDDVSVVWPTSRELFAGRAPFIHVNEQFPGQWRFLPHTINALDNGQVLSITHVISPDCDDHFFATSLFAFRANQICAITTYWAFADEQPVWRQGLSDVY